MLKENTVEQNDHISALFWKLKENTVEQNDHISALFWKLVTISPFSNKDESVFFQLAKFMYDFLKRINQ